MKDALNKLIEEIAKGQQEKLLKCARQIIPHLTAEDILQPNDYHELELNPHLRYEEGVLEGIRTVQAALRASKLFEPDGCSKE